jgi:hypothetical protein
MVFSWKENLVWILVLSGLMDYLKGFRMRQYFMQLRITVEDNHNGNTSLLPNHNYLSKALPLQSNTPGC